MPQQASVLPRAVSFPLQKVWIFHVKDDHPCLEFLYGSCNRNRARLKKELEPQAPSGHQKDLSDCQRSLCPRTLPKGPLPAALSRLVGFDAREGS